MGFKAGEPVIHLVNDYERVWAHEWDVAPGVRVVVASLKWSKA